MTDNELLFDFLYSHFDEWWNVIDISRILKHNCVNWAIRSRRSDLNKRFIVKKEPYYIERRLGENGCAEYKLVGEKSKDLLPVGLVLNGDQVEIELQ